VSRPHVGPIAKILGVAAVLAAAVAASALQLAAQPLAVDEDDLAGVVTSRNGPESGVWVIAETTDLPTKFAKIVVTDDEGRYVLPDLSRASYQDKRITANPFGIAPAPDGSVWGSYLGFPGGLFRLTPGSNPSETAIAEVFEVPYNHQRVSEVVFSPRGMDVDRNNVVWTPLASGHLASFDRRKCEGPLNGPGAIGQHCPEGWTFHQEPIPQLQGVADGGSAESSYYVWVDQFDTFGLGANVPINTGNGSEGLLALKDGRWVVLRVPYPLGFYAKWMDGRIDDPNTGWKGRGLWATTSTRAPFHMETGKDTYPKLMHFQLRPDPLAR
jgi:hypothetical protein